MSYKTLTLKLTYRPCAPLFTTHSIEINGFEPIFHCCVTLKNYLISFSSNTTQIGATRVLSIMQHALVLERTRWKTELKRKT